VIQLNTRQVVWWVRIFQRFTVSPQEKHWRWLTWIYCTIRWVAAERWNQNIYRWTKLWANSDPVHELNDSPYYSGWLATGVQ